MLLFLYLILAHKMLANCRSNNLPNCFQHFNQSFRKHFVRDLKEHKRCRIKPEMHALSNRIKIIDVEILIIGCEHMHNKLLFNCIVEFFMLFQLFLFKLISRNICPDDAPFVQCVDTISAESSNMAPYYFFTMIMSFILPLVFSVGSYSMILYEITNMQKRDEGTLILWSDLISLPINTASKAISAESVMIRLNELAL